MLEPHMSNVGVNDRFRKETEALLWSGKAQHTLGDAVDVPGKWVGKCVRGRAASKCARLTPIVHTARRPFWWVNLRGSRPLPRLAYAPRPASKSVHLVPFQWARGRLRIWTNEETGNAAVAGSRSSFVPTRATAGRYFTMWRHCPYARLPTTLRLPCESPTWGAGEFAEQTRS